MPTKSELETQNEELQMKVELLEEQAVEQSEQIENLNRQLAKLSGDKQQLQARTAVLPTVKVNDQVLRFMVPAFIYDLKKYTAEEAAEDEELILKLLEIKSGVLAPVDQ